MRPLARLFTKHPEAVGETYFQHMGVAFSFGAKMVLSGLACLIHGIFPFFCITTGSKTVTKLHENMVTHRDRRHANETKNDGEIANAA